MVQPVSIVGFTHVPNNSPWMFNAFPEEVPVLVSAVDLVHPFWAVEPYSALSIFEDRWIMLGFSSAQSRYVIATSYNNGTSWEYVEDTTSCSSYWLRKGNRFWAHYLYECQYTDDFIAWSEPTPLLTDYTSSSSLEAHVTDPQSTLHQVVCVNKASPFSLIYQRTSDFGESVYEQTIRNDTSGQALKEIWMTANDGNIFVAIYYGEHVDLMYSHDNGVTWGTITTDIVSPKGIKIILTDLALYLCGITTTTYTEYRATNITGSGAPTFSTNRIINAIDLPVFEDGDDPVESGFHFLCSSTLMLGRDEPGIILCGYSEYGQGLWYAPQSGEIVTVNSLLYSTSPYGIATHYWPFMCVWTKEVHIANWLISDCLFEEHS